MPDLIAFRPGPLIEALRERSDRAEVPADDEPDRGLSLVARRDLARYYALLADELRCLELSEAEASLIVDATNGLWIDERTCRYLPFEIEEAISIDHLDAKWGVDRAELLAKLQAATPGQLMALADAKERFWNHPNPLPDALRRAGLVR